MDKGTGLRLTTVYNIVEQNRGFITVDSQPGQGSAFRIFFPPHAQETENTQENMQPLTTALDHETILLVEDGAMTLDITSTMLSIHGYKVLSVSTPSEAHQLAREYAARSIC